MAGIFSQRSPEAPAPGNFPLPAAAQASLPRGMPASDQAFANPFAIADLAVFDDVALRALLAGASADLDQGMIADALHGAPAHLGARMARAVPVWQRLWFRFRLWLPAGDLFIQAARQRVLDALFWELTYWRTPELYDELTAGERIHPGIFAALRDDLRGKVVLDAGAGSGRVTFAALRQGVAHIYASDPSPGLLRLLAVKADAARQTARITLVRARFDALPLPDDSVDTTISCAAFTSDPTHGGETGLAELWRVTRPGGMIALIWPRPADYLWLAAHGFQYVALPTNGAMRVRFRSLRRAIQVAQRFYARNPTVVRFLRRAQQPEIPFRMLGMNEPCDYCWQRVVK